MLWLATRGEDSGSPSEFSTILSPNAPSNHARMASTPAGNPYLSALPSGVTLAAEGGAHQSIKTPSMGPRTTGLCQLRTRIFRRRRRLVNVARLPVPPRAAGRLLGLPEPVDPARRPDAGSSPIGPCRTGAPPPAGRRWRLPTGSPRRRQGHHRGNGRDDDRGPRRRSTAHARRSPRRRVLCITSPGLLFKAIQARRGRGTGETWILDQLFPSDCATPLLTVLDGHPHALAFLPGINRVRHTALGVSRFGQVGSLDDAYRYHGIDSDSIVCAALDLL